MAWGLFLAGRVEVVLGLGVRGVVHCGVGSLFPPYVAVFCVQGVPPPLGVGAFSLFYLIPMHWSDRSSVD